jgi:hypothetical protein
MFFHNTHTLPKLIAKMRNNYFNDKNISLPSNSLESKKPEKKSDKPEMKANFVGQAGSPGDWMYFDPAKKGCDDKETGKGM